MTTRLVPVTRNGYPARCCIVREIQAPSTIVTGCGEFPMFVTVRYTTQASVDCDACLEWLCKECA